MLIWLSQRELIVIEYLLGVGGNITPSLELVVVLLHLERLGEHQVSHLLAVHHHYLINLILSDRVLLQVKIPQRLIMRLL